MLKHQRKAHSQVLALKHAIEVEFWITIMDLAMQDIAKYINLENKNIALIKMH